MQLWEAETAGVWLLCVVGRVEGIALSVPEVIMVHCCALWVATGMQDIAIFQLISRAGSGKESAVESLFQPLCTSHIVIRGRAGLTVR